MNPSLTLVIIAVAVFGMAALLVKLAVSSFGAYKNRFTNDARSRLEEAFLFVDPRRVFGGMLLGAVIITVVVWFVTGNPLLTVLAPVITLAMPRISFAVINRRRRAKIVLQLPDTLLMIGSALRSGTNLQIALDLAIRETPAPLSQELGVVAREQRLGMALEDALESMSARLKLEEIDLVVAAMTIARDVGGNLAETLDRMSATLRAKATMEGKIRSLTSQGKLQGLIVGLLPVFLMVVLSYMQPDSMRPLFHEPIGWAALGVILILESIGFAMIRKIVAIDV